MTTLTLRCYIWGEPSNRVFDLEIKNEVYIAHLRETIRKKKELPVNRSLVLFKVAISHMNVRLGFRVRGTPNDLDGAILLLPEQELADIFKLGDSLNPQEIHIIVMEWCRGVVPLTLTKFYPRAELVKALYNKLSTERFVQVRGPPASGKSALSHLLAAYIEKEEPGVAISYISDWHQDEIKNYPTGFWGWLRLHNWVNPDLTSVLFINAGQLSYWDKNFWITYMMNFNQESLPRVVIFTSYGSPISDPQDNPTPPMKIADTNRVSLRHDDELGSVGLLLTHKEFGEYTQHSRSGHAFDKSLLQLVYRITGGYIGMINILFDMVQRHKSYTHPATQGKMYTLVDFIESIPISDFFNALLSSVVLRRVLPSRQDIDEGSNALRVVLETASIHGFVTSEMLTTANAKKALQSCFEKAWLHADLLHGEVRYIFPSPLQRRCIQAQLLGLVDQTDVQIVEETLPEFAWTILNLFLPSNLSTHGTASAASTEIQRAIYDEFYRCCCVHAKGPIVTPPEFGSRTESRVDLFIPQKRWGVQLLYNGDHLDEYASSFSTSGEYGAWIKSERGGDYIILNFCHEVPSKAHPGVSNLYHIVAEGCWNARIFDHELKLVVNEDSRNVRIPDNATQASCQQGP